MKLFLFCLPFLNLIAPIFLSTLSLSKSEEEISKVAIVCKLDEEICGSTCFNPKTQNCHKGKSPRHDFPCRFNENICGENLCYSPGRQRCIENRTVCRIEENECGRSVCYSPGNGQTCIIHEDGSTIVCGVGEISCGKSQCFSPTNGQQCIIDESKSTIVCQVGEKSCGGKCYNPANQQCINIKEKNENESGNVTSIVCLIGEKACGSSKNPKCFSNPPKKCYEFENGKSLVCLDIEKPCGQEKCYSIIRGESCFDVDVENENGNEKGKLFCKFGGIPCSNTLCVYPGESCFAEEKMTCQIDLLPCGNVCYSPIEQECIHINNNNNSISSSHIVCQIGDKVCGKSCFKPAIEKCIVFLL